ncbi:hypothetical protein BO99DRAFT_492 [Aspergillus violaceofuscus CBS 115571]|uniref:Uncharacterized protein n=1 Tax=Aspergillus violaceofuscus (strain CBS 115571) TaxID=1450538 RepID=A0A2V5HJF9_ASPV1|nr:hypothetical protein BO99DRAFT_492 [Aspergillus violaceofuscus CBS 115571]
MKLPKAAICGCACLGSSYFFNSHRVALAKALQPWRMAGNSTARANEHGPDRDRPRDPGSDRLGGLLAHSEMSSSIDNSPAVIVPPQPLSETM